MASLLRVLFLQSSFFFSRLTIIRTWSHSTRYNQYKMHSMSIKLRLWQFKTLNTSDTQYVRLIFIFFVCFYFCFIFSYRGLETQRHRRSQEFCTNWRLSERIRMTRIGLKVPHICSCESRSHFHFLKKSLGFTIKWMI